MQPRFGADEDAKDEGRGRDGMIRATMKKAGNAGFFHLLVGKSKALLEISQRDIKQDF